MIFKSPIQPLCRTCGKPIRKWTEDVRVFAEPPRTHVAETAFGTGADRFKSIPTGRMTPLHVPKHVVGQPRTREEAQKLVNMKIVSNRTTAGLISKITVWDGESYADEFFHNGECARAFGYMCAGSSKLTICSTAWADAVKRQREKLAGAGLATPPTVALGSTEPARTPGDHKTGDS